MPEKAETRGKDREVLIAHSMFDPEVFKMFMKAANRNQIGEVWWICLLESMELALCLCHKSDTGEHRRLKGVLSKLMKVFFILSARQKIHFLIGRCNTCLTKERSMPVRAREHVLSLTGRSCT